MNMFTYLKYLLIAYFSSVFRKKENNSSEISYIYEIDEIKKERNTRKKD